MKKNIAIVVLSIVTILSFVFSFAQKTIADRNANEAHEQRLIAEKQTELAMMARDEAALAQMTAMEAQRAADEALRQCNEELEKCK